MAVGVQSRRCSRGATCIGAVHLGACERGDAVHCSRVRPPCRSLGGSVSPADMQGCRLPLLLLAKTQTLMQEPWHPPWTPWCLRLGGLAPVGTHPKPLNPTCRPATSCRCCSLLKLLPATSREVRSTLLLLVSVLVMPTASAAGAE